MQTELASPELQLQRTADMADTRRTLHIASWDDRFLAWLLDIVLVGAVVSAVGEAAGVFALLAGGLSGTTRSPA